MEETNILVNLSITVDKEGQCHCEIEGMDFLILAAYTQLTEHIMENLLHDDPDFVSPASQTLLNAYSMGINSAIEKVQKKGGEK